MIGFALRTLVFISFLRVNLGATCWGEAVVESIGTIIVVVAKLEGTNNVALGSLDPVVRGNHPPTVHFQQLSVEI